MEEYPRTLAELEANFSTEEACRAYLYRLRWPDGFRCPKCGHGKAWPIGIRLFQCVAWLRKADLCDCWQHLSGYPDAPEHMVPSHTVGY